MCPQAWGASVPVWVRSTPGPPDRDPPGCPRPGLPDRDLGDLAETTRPTVYLAETTRSTIYLAETLEDLVETTEAMGTWPMADPYRR